MKRQLPSWLVPALAGLLFLLTGLAFIPWPGLQNDELFFAGAFFSPDSALYSLQVGGAKIPFMVLSYYGALKTWLYAGIFQFFAPTEWSVRIPMLLTGVGTIWLTWGWVKRIAGTRAAAVTTVLLATDTIFLLTNTFDWGPVAFQHIFLMGGLVTLQRWLDNKSNPMLALTFFLWGLGMWDKALFAWPLIGMAVASFCVYPRAALRRVRFVPVAIAVASFLTGAAPLVWFNIARPGQTATQNASFTTEGVRNKVAAFRQTIDGSTLFGYMVYDDPAPAPREPRGKRERLPVWISQLAGDHRTNWMLPAWALGFVCSLLLWNSPVRRILLFLLIAVAVEWAQMAITKNTGAASHHVMLLWPFPVAFLGIAFSAMADRIPRYGRPVLAALVVFLAGENLLTTNHYLARFIVNGGCGGWTDAVDRLADSIEDKSASWFGLVDWGYLSALRTLHEGDLPLFTVDVNGADFARQVNSPDFLYIQHTDDKQMFPGVNDRVRKAASDLGYRERIERTVRDRNGRPVFELFRFQKTDPR
jgi:4-amino-4-deoxy-L-arabinose transferase-like glycosyltransferase